MSQNETELNHSKSKNNNQTPHLAMVPNKINKEKVKQKQAQVIAAATSLKVKKKDPESTKTTEINNKKNHIVPDENDDEDGMKQMVGGCCVCADDTGSANNLLVYCDGCDVAVHQGCYGIITVPDGDWFCRRCEFMRKNNVKYENVCCQLCAIKEGAVKRTDTSKWAHVVCALFIPEISFGNNRSMEPIILKDIDSDRLDKKCSICELNNLDVNNESLLGEDTAPLNQTAVEVGKKSYSVGHAYVNCNKSGCKHWYHVTCAQSKGLLCEDHTVSQNNVTYCVFCKYHHSKLTSSAIKRLPPFINNDKQMTLPILNTKPTSSLTTTTPQAKQKRKSTSSTKDSDKVKKTRTSNVTDVTVSSSSPVASDKKVNKTPSRPSRSNSITTSSGESLTELVQPKNSEEKPNIDPQTSKKSKPSTETPFPLTDELTPIKSEPLIPKQKQKMTKKLQPENLNQIDSILPVEAIKAELITKPLSTELTEPQVKATIATSEPRLLNLHIQIEKLSNSSDSAAVVKGSNEIDPITVQTNINEISEGTNKSENAELKNDSTVTGCDTELKRKLTENINTDLADELISNNLNTPTSSHSCSSSTSSVKSPKVKRQRNTDQPTTDTAAATSAAKPNAALNIVEPNLHSQATTPLTPPPSVTQDSLHDIYNNNIPKSIVANIAGEQFKQPNSLKALSVSSCKAPEETNGKRIATEEAQSVTEKNFENVEELENEEESDELPFNTEELLRKQWSLGNDLILEQSKNFDVMVFLDMLKDCKKENEELEKKLSDLEASHTKLLNMNEKLNVPLNPPKLNHSRSESDLQRSHKSFQPIVVPPMSAATSHLTVPKTPTKQSLNSLLISASPISSASSPNNSSLMHSISFPAGGTSPLNTTTTTTTHKNSVMKNNTINNTSINNNINLISQSDNCFYNLNSINKLSGVKNMNFNYSNSAQNNNLIESNSLARASEMPREQNRYQSPTLHRSQNFNDQHQNSNQANHLAGVLSDTSKYNHLNGSPSKNNVPSQISMAQQQLQQHHQSHPLFNLNSYQQQLYYAYIMQQQANLAHGDKPLNPSDPSSFNIPNTSGNSPSNHNPSISNASKQAANLSKAILESNLSNIISKS